MTPAPQQYPHDRRPTILAGVVLALAALFVAGCAAPQPTAEPSPTVTEAPVLTPTLGPAPAEDRVGLPENYQDTYEILYVWDNVANSEVRVVLASTLEGLAAPGDPFQHGTILVMEVYGALKDETGEPQTDPDGRFLQDELKAISIMRKEPGFGEAYEHLRTGEWEYVVYLPDGTYHTPPERTASCAQCHQLAGEERDWVFRGNLFFESPDRYGRPVGIGGNEVLISSTAFHPDELTVRAGTAVTWVNDDVVPHTVVAGDGSFESNILDPGERFTVTLQEPGAVEYVGGVLPHQIRGTVHVTD